MLNSTSHRLGRIGYLLGAMSDSLAAVTPKAPVIEQSIIRLANARSALAVLIAEAEAAEATPPIVADACTDDDGGPAGCCYRCGYTGDRDRVTRLFATRAD